MNNVKNPTAPLSIHIACVRMDTYLVVHTLGVHTNLHKCKQVRTNPHVRISENGQNTWQRFIGETSQEI